MNAASEAVKPKGGGCRPQLTTLSMFEWPPGLEQKRESEPVSAGR